MSKEPRIAGCGILCVLNGISAAARGHVDESEPMKHTHLLIGAVLVFFLACTTLLFGAPQKYSSPDETANYLATAGFARGKGLALESPLTVPGGIVAPRNFTAAEGKLLPASFIGMPLLYGSIAGIVGTWAVPFLTPLLSVAAVIAAYFLCSMFMQRRLALLTTVLIAFHPAFWYYTSRGMFHNAAFFDLALIGTFALLHAALHSAAATSTRKALWYALAGLSFGVAVAVRTSEAVWLGAVVLALLVALRRKLDLRLGIGALAAGAVLPMLAVFYYNTQLFGQALSFGYTQTAIDTSSVAAASSGVLDKVGSLFFPFGFDAGAIARNFWDYGFRIFGIPAVFALCGFVMALRSKVSAAGKLYLGIVLFVGAWLVVYYGSRVIQDNPDPNAVTIGTSYVRYWIPLYALSMPFAALFLSRVAERFGRWRRQALVGLAGVFVAGSLAAVITSEGEGLAAVRAGTLEYSQLSQRASQLTPANAVILAGRGDKVFFPERSVIASVETPQQLSELRTLVSSVPVFVYVSAAQSPAGVRQTWEQRGFSLGDEITMAEYERLYRMSDALKGTP